MNAIEPAAYRVTSNEPETADVRTLRLAPLAGSRLSYEPGQFTMLYAFGAGEVPISVSGHPSDPEGELVQTIRAVGAATTALCELEEGAELGVRGPYGRGWPDPGGAGDEDLLLVAGGLGLAPLRPALLGAIRGRERFRRVILLYGGREPDQLVFRDQLEAWSSSSELECELIVDIARSGWHGRVGVVPSLIERVGIEPSRTTALVCGPEVMMRFTAEALLAEGLDAERLFVSMERNMRCAVGHCGHCQWGADFICRDGPVFDWSKVEGKIGVREL